MQWKENVEIVLYWCWVQKWIPSAQAYVENKALLFTCWSSYRAALHLFGQSIKQLFLHSSIYGILFSVYYEHCVYSIKYIYEHKLLWKFTFRTRSLINFHHQRKLSFGFNFLFLEIAEAEVLESIEYGMGETYHFLHSKHFIILQLLKQYFIFLSVAFFIVWLLFKVVIFPQNMHKIWNSEKVFLPPSR